MNKKIKIVIVVLVIMIISVLVYKSIQSAAIIEEAPVTPIATVDPIKGCYVARLAKDVYTINIESQNVDSVLGTLSIKNFEKDSSSGTYKGVYKNGIMLGDYTFNSEGTDSVIQVVFKKVESGFVRGYGDMTADGTQFVDVNAIKFDDTYIFTPSTDCGNIGV